MRSATRLQSITSADLRDSGSAVIRWVLMPFAAAFDHFMLPTVSLTTILSLRGNENLPRILRPPQYDTLSS
jgi:hypothetical protein